MNNTTTEGSKFYLYSITAVAILGGLLFGYDTAVVSGAEKGLEAFFLLPPIFNMTKYYMVLLLPAHYWVVLSEEQFPAYQHCV